MTVSETTGTEPFRKMWGWAENPNCRVTGPLGPIWVYLVGLGGLGGVQIDRKKSEIDLDESSARELPYS